MDAALLSILKNFIGPSQLRVLGSNCRGAEGAFFRQMLGDLVQLIATMPKVYEQALACAAYLIIYRGLKL